MVTAWSLLLFTHLIVVIEAVVRKKSVVKVCHFSEIDSIESIYTLCKKSYTLSPATKMHKELQDYRSFIATVPTTASATRGDHIALSFTMRIHFGRAPEWNAIMGSCLQLSTQSRTIHIGRLVPVLSMHIFFARSYVSTRQHVWVTRRIDQRFSENRDRDPRYQRGIKFELNPRYLSAQFQI